MDPYPYWFYVALDGNGVNGLEGRAGVCLFKYDPDGDRFAYKAKFFDGAAGGHAVSISPDGSLGFLGNLGQHLLFFDPRTLEELSRVSTLRFASADTSIRGSTHLVWTGPTEVIT